MLFDFDKKTIYGWADYRLMDEPGRRTRFLRLRQQKKKKWFWMTLMPLKHTVCVFLALRLNSLKKRVNLVLKNFFSYIKIKMQH